MAEATKVPTDYSLQLTLSQREAEILLRLTAMVCQGRTGSDPIYEALRDAGVMRNDNYRFLIKSGNVHSIEFSEKT